MFRIHADRIYSDSAAIESDIVTINARLADIERVKPDVTREPRALLEALQLNAALATPLDRLWVYGAVLRNQNLHDTGAKQNYERVANDIEARTAFISTTVRSLSDQELEVWLRQEPALEVFRPWFARLRRNRPHVLSGALEVEQSKAERDSIERSIESYNATLDAAPFGRVSSNGVTYEVRRQFESIMRLPDRAVREAAFSKRVGAYRAAGDSFASNLLRVANDGLAFSKKRQFADALDGSLFDLYLNARGVEEILAAFSSHAETARRFQRADANLRARQLGITKLQPWDAEAPAPGLATPRFSLTHAVVAIEKASRVFGNEYLEALSYVLDPSRRLIDLVPGEGRAPGATTYGPVGGDPMLFMEGFNGELADVVTLAHELTHAVHFRLMEVGKVPPSHREGARYLFEGMAKVNELLVLDALAEHAEDAVRLVLLRELCAKLASVKFTTMYWAVAATEFEFSVNRGVAQGRVAKNEDVHQAWLASVDGVSEGYARIPDAGYLWADTPNFFKWPRTYVSYLYAWVIAASLYEKARVEPESLRRVSAFMQLGFPTEPIGLLRDRLGVDIEDAETVESSLRLLDERVTDFEAAAAEAQRTRP